MAGETQLFPHNTKKKANSCVILLQSPPALLSWCCSSSLNTAIPKSPQKEKGEKVPHWHLLLPYIVPFSWFVHGGINGVQPQAINSICEPNTEEYVFHGFHGYKRCPVCPLFLSGPTALSQEDPVVPLLMCLSSHTNTHTYWPCCGRWRPGTVRYLRTLWKGERGHRRDEASSP